MMNEEKIDRRAHWVQIAVTGIVLATGWCVKLEINGTQRDTTIKEMKHDWKIDHDQITKDSTEIDWLKNELSRLQKN